MHWLVLVPLKSLIVSSRLHQTSSGLIVVFCSSKAVTAMPRIIVGNCPGSELPMIRTQSQIPTHLASLFCAKIQVRAKMHVLLNSGSIALLNWSSAQSFWWLERTQRAKIPTPFGWEGLRGGSMPCSFSHINKRSKRFHIDISTRGRRGSISTRGCRGSICGESWRDHKCSAADTNALNDHLRANTFQC